MEPNPYAPPKAAVDDQSSASSTGLKRRRVIVMILLTIVTFGLYYPIWFFRRRDALNRLDSPRKLRLWPPVLFCAVTVVDVVLAFVSAPAPLAQTIGDGANTALTVVRLAVGILMVVQSFHRQRHPGRPSGWTGRRTFTFGVRGTREAVGPHDVLLQYFLSSVRH
jgi:hypothetical protein